MDDDSAIQASITLLLEREGYQADTASNLCEASDLLRRASFDLVLLDLNFSPATTGQEGLSFLAQLKSAYPGLPVVLITAWASIALAVEGMKLGAADFVSKPWDN